MGPPTQDAATSGSELGPELRTSAIDDGDHHRLDLVVGERSIRRPELEGEGQALAAFRETPVSGALEQSMFHANQIVQFGKLLAGQVRA